MTPENIYEDGLAECLDNWDKECLRIHGWYLYYLADENIAPLGLLAYTCGIPRNFNHHLDFQIVMPIDRNRVLGIFHNLVDGIRSGRRFRAGVRAQGIIPNYSVTFMLADQGDRTVLRVILPDDEDNLEPGTFARPEFELQYSH